MSIDILHRQFLMKLSSQILKVAMQSEVLSLLKVRTTRLQLYIKITSRLARFEMQLSLVPSLFLSLSILDDAKYMREAEVVSEV